MTQKRVYKKKKRSVRMWLGRMLSMVGVAGICVLAVIKVVTYYMPVLAEYLEADNYTDQEGGKLQKPVMWQTDDLYKQLKKMAKTNDTAEMLYENRYDYPENLLSAYMNNPEMEQYVKGYLTADATKIGGLTRKEKKEKYPFLLQWDKRWGYAPYGESVIGLSGCGPTCLSMVLLQLLGDETLTPYEVASFSEENGYYVEGSGTSWALMTDGAAQYGIKAIELSLSENKIKQALEEKKPIICSMGPGDFTTKGHFIVIYKYDENGFYIHDPNSSIRSGQVWSFEELSYQIKNIWAYSK